MKSAASRQAHRRPSPAPPKRKNVFRSIREAVGCETILNFVFRPKPSPPKNPRDIGRSSRIFTPRGRPYRLEA